jgi:hypothetical protein
VGHADAQRNRMPWVANPNGFAVQIEGSGMCSVDAGDDLDQDRFAGAILSQKRVNRTLPQPQRDVIQSAANTGKGLANIAVFKDQVDHRQILLIDFSNCISRNRLTPTAHEAAEDNLNDERIDFEQHQSLRNNGNSDDAQERAGKAHVTAAQRCSPNDGPGMVGRARTWYF